MAHGIGYSEEQSPTLRSQAGGNSVPCILCQTPTHAAGESGRPNGQAAVYDTTQITSPANWSNPQPGSPSHPLCAGAHAPVLVEPVVRNEPGPKPPLDARLRLPARRGRKPPVEARPSDLFCPKSARRGSGWYRPALLRQRWHETAEADLAYALQGNGIDRADTAGCNGCGWKMDVGYTLNTIDRHAVCYQNTAGALCAADWRGPNRQYAASDKLVVDLLCTDARYGDGQTCSTITGDAPEPV